MIVAESRALSVRRGGRDYGQRMDLPVMPPVQPMLAKPVKGVPKDAGYSFEPKWDGF